MSDPFFGLFIGPLIAGCLAFIAATLSNIEGYLGRITTELERRRWDK